MVAEVVVPGRRSDVVAWRTCLMGKVQALDSGDIQTCGLCDVDGLGWKGEKHCGGIATRRGKGEEAIVLYIQSRRMGR